MNTRTRLIVIPALAAAGVMTIAACGSSSSESSTSSSPSATTANASAPFGPGCSAVPTSGPGSVAEMAKVPVGTAAASNPLLTTLAAQVKAAGLGETLNSPLIQRTAAELKSPLASLSQRLESFRTVGRAEDPGRADVVEWH